jgi:DNA-binding NarL/FixJ family response regulator
MPAAASTPPVPAPDAANPVQGSVCPICRRTALRLREVEAATDGLRREVELGARRLQKVMDQLARFEERAGRAAPAGALRPAPAQHLGARESQVLRLLTEGHRTPAIAEAMGITPATVEVHRRNIMRKLGLHTVAGLTKYALREGLTSL